MKTNLSIKFILISFTLTFLNSCVITNTPGFYNGYKKLTPEEKSSVVMLSSDSKLETLTNNRQIVAINGKQLVEYSKDIETLVVYRWSPNCSSDVCILISACQEYCNSKGYKLVVVSEYYDIEKMEFQNTGNLPILIPNHIYYKKYYANSLNNLFFKDLLNGDELIEEEKYNNRFLFFNRGKFTESRRDLFNE